MGNVTRRDFLRTGVHAGAAIAGAQLLSGCGTSLPFAPLDLPDASTEAAAVVAAAKRTDLAQMARDALAAIGGIEAFVHPGESVFIKPNFGAAGMVKYNPVAAGDAAKPEIVLAVAEECLRAGASSVVIGEAGQVPQFTWDTLRTLDDTTNMADEAARLNAAYGDKLSLACLNRDSPAWDAVSSPYTGLGEIEVSSLAVRADRVISIPVLKTHRWTKLTGSIKNLLGLTSSERYGRGMGWRMDLHECAGGPGQAFVDIAAAIKPDLAIMDISICCEGNGPHVLPGWWGTSVDVRDRLGSWLVLASSDLVAIDATAARILGYEPLDIDHLARAYKLGLGQADAGRITLLGATIEELRMDWTPAELTEGFMEVLLPGFMLIS